MKENNTKPTIIDVSTYINQLDESKKLEAKELIHLFSEASLEKPVMWGLRLSVLDKRFIIMNLVEK